MTKKPIQIVVMGAGTAGQRHIAAVLRSPCTELAAIVDVNPESLQQFSAIDTVRSTSLRDTLAGLQPDGVVVATPTDDHARSAVEVLDAGVAVLLEKPAAATLEEADNIMAAAKRANRPVLVGHQRRYHRQVEEAASMIDSGQLGRLVLVSGMWGVRKHSGYYQPEWRRNPAAGPIMINLTHDIDLLRHLCGGISELFAYSDHSVENLAKEDAVALSLRFHSGALGTFAASDRVVSPWSWEFATGENVICPESGQNCIHFFGTEASLEFPNLVIWKQGKQNADWTGRISPNPCQFPYEDPFVRQIEHFADVVMGNAKPRVTLADAMQNVEAALAVFESARSGRSIQLNQDDSVV